VTLTTITQVVYTTAAIIKRGMTAAADLLMVLSLRGVAIDGKMDVADKACPSRSSASFAGKRNHVSSRDGDHMLVGPSSIKLSDHAGSNVPPGNLSSSSVHRQFIVSSSLHVSKMSRRLTGFGRRIGKTSCCVSASNCLPLSKFASPL